MTFETEKNKLGRIPVTVLEVDMDSCTRTYGLGLCGAGSITQGTTQGGTTVTDIVLESAASDADDEYNGMNLKINGEERLVLDYVGSTRIATVTAFTVSVTTEAYTLHNIESPLACFNTLSNCQDAANFDKQIKTYRFISEQAGLPDKHPLWIPCLVKSDTRPAILTDDRTLGIRAQASVTLRDFSSNDTEFGQDKYFFNRTYDAEAQGTFWGKFKSRNEFYINRAARLKFGYIPARVSFDVIFSDTTSVGYGDSIVQLSAGASSLDGDYIGKSILLTDVPDIDRARGIIAYDGISKVAIVERAYSTAYTAISKPYRVITTEDELPYEEFDFDSAFQSNEYVIDRFEGPDAKGRVKFVLKDPISLAENDRAIAPVPTNATLTADITDAVTSFTLTGDHTQFGATGTLQLNDEQMTYTKGATTATTVTMTVVRGVNGSEAQAHGKDDNAQDCYVVTSQNVVDIISDLLTIYAGIDPTLIPAAEWATIKTNFVPANNYSLILGQPTGVNDLLSELVEENLLALWFETSSSKIKLDSLIPGEVSTLPVYDDDEHFLKNTFQPKDQPKDRLSRVVIVYGKRNQALPIATDNARFSYIADDSSAQQADQFGDLRTHLTESRWMSDLNNGQAINYAEKLLGRYRKVPTNFKFQMDFKDSDLVAGTSFIMKSRSHQGLFGEPLLQRCRILSADKINGTTVAFTASTVDFEVVDANLRFFIIADNDAPDYAVATDLEKEQNGYFADDILETVLGDPPYLIL